MVDFFFCIFYKGDNFCACLFAFLHAIEKQSILKGKNLLPKGGIFFPFTIDPFSKGGKNNFCRIASHGSVSIPLS